MGEAQTRHFYDFPMIRRIRILNSPLNLRVCLDLRICLDLLTFSGNIDLRQLCDGDFPRIMRRQGWESV